MIVRYKKEEVGTLINDPKPQPTSVVETQSVEQDDVNNDLVTIKKSELDAVIESCISKTINELNNQQRDITLFEFMETYVSGFENLEEVGKIILNTFITSQKSSILYREMCNIIVDNGLLDDMLSCILKHHEIMMNKPFTRKQFNVMKDEFIFSNNKLLEKIGNVMMTYYKNNSLK